MDMPDERCSAEIIADLASRLIAEKERADRMEANAAREQTKVAILKIALDDIAQLLGCDPYGHEIKAKILGMFKALKCAVVALQVQSGQRDASELTREQLAGMVTSLVASREALQAERDDKRETRYPGEWLKNWGA
jgi:hypothetical protein